MTNEGACCFRNINNNNINNNNYPCIVENIVELPEDKLQKIFAYLDWTSRFQTELVCKRFFKVVQQVWKSEFKLVIDDQCPLKAWDRFYNDKPALLDWHRFGRRIWRPLIERCEHVCDLELCQNFVLSKTDVQNIVISCPMLSALKLPSILLSAECLEPLALLSRLQRIEFGDTNVWKINIEFDLWTLTASDYVNYCLYKPRGVDRSDFCWHSAKSFSLSDHLGSCFQRWTRLKSLQLNVYKIAPGVLVDCLMKLSETLRHITVDGAKPVDHKAALAQFFQTRYFLNSISLEFVVEPITTTASSSSSSSLDHVTERFSNETFILNKISVCCLMLETLEIRYYGNIDPFPSSLNFRRMQKLKNLTVVNANFGKSLDFVKTIPNLQRLNLAGILNDTATTTSDSVEDDEYNNTAEEKNLWNVEWGVQKLTHLNIKLQRRYFTIEDLISILATNSRLAVLEIPLIARPNDAELWEIARNCQSLNELILSNFYNPFSNQDLFENLAENIFHRCRPRPRDLKLIVKTCTPLIVTERLSLFPIRVQLID